MYVTLAGKSPLLAIPSAAFGVSPCFTGTSLPVGAKSSARGVTLTLIATSSEEPSGYPTVMVAGFVPGVLVSGAVPFQVYVVPIGRVLLFVMASPAFGVSPCFTVRS